MIKIYATNDNGEGYVQEIGVLKELSDIEIRVGMFDKDVVITFEEENLEEEIKQIDPEELFNIQVKTNDLLGIKKKK